MMNCRWYYSNARRNLEEAVPEVKELLAQVEEPHTQLHKSAVALEKLLQKGKEFRPEAVRYYQTETRNRLQQVQGMLKKITPWWNSMFRRPTAQRRNQPAGLGSSCWWG